jgi:hypothetical protein
MQSTDATQSKSVRGRLWKRGGEGGRLVGKYRERESGI